ncbi:MAG: hypothetical protein QXN95_03720 [Candidatus Bathyarchaeia archaeon]
MIHSTMVHRQHAKQGIDSLLVQSFAEFAFERGANVIEDDVEEGPDKF